MAEKKPVTWNQQDSLSWLKTPMAEVNGPCTRPSPEPSQLFSAALAHCIPPPVQQGSSLHSTVSWDSSQLEALNRPRPSDVIKFSIGAQLRRSSQTFLRMTCHLTVMAQQRSIVTRSEKKNLSYHLLNLILLMEKLPCIYSTGAL